MTLPITNKNFDRATTVEDLDLADDTGLELPTVRAALLALADSDDVKAEVVDNTERAVARGAFGIPTFFVGEEMFFGKERLPQVAEALAQRG